MPFFPPGRFSPIRSQGLSDAARSLDATPMPAALAWLLAWLLRRSPNLLPVPGTSSRWHLRENRAAAALDGLADERARPGD